MSWPWYYMICSQASGKGAKNKVKAKGKGKVNGGAGNDDDLDAIMAEIEGVGSTKAKVRICDNCRLTTRKDVSTADCFLSC